jgi:hypothetical protein
MGPPGGGRRLGGGAFRFQDHVMPGAYLGKVGAIMIRSSQMTKIRKIKSNAASKTAREMTRFHCRLGLGVA